MTDGSASQWPPHIAALYQEDTAQLRFLKRQQWAITNYLIALLAGIFGIVSGIGGIAGLEKYIAIVLIIIATVGALVLLTVIQCHMEKPRNRLAKMYDYWECDERKKFGLKTTPTNWRSDLTFIIPLFLVCLIGALIVGYAVVISEPHAISATLTLT